MAVVRNQDELRAWFAEQLAANHAVISLDEIIEIGAETSGFLPEQLIGPRRTPRLVQARWLTMLAARGQGYSMPEIAAAFSRDPTTVSHALQQLTGLPGGEV